MDTPILSIFVRQEDGSPGQKIVLLESSKFRLTDVSVPAQSRQRWAITTWADLGPDPPDGLGIGTDIWPTIGQKKINIRLKEGSLWNDRKAEWEFDGYRKGPAKDNKLEKTLNVKFLLVVV